MDTSLQIDWHIPLRNLFLRTETFEESPHGTFSHVPLDYKIEYDPYELQFQIVFFDNYTDHKFQVGKLLAVFTQLTNPSSMPDTECKYNIPNLEQVTSELKKNKRLWHHLNKRYNKGIKKATEKWDTTKCVCDELRKHINDNKMLVKKDKHSVKQKFRDSGKSRGSFVLIKNNPEENENNPDNYKKHVSEMLASISSKASFIYREIFYETNPKFAYKRINKHNNTVAYYISDGLGNGISIVGEEWHATSCLHIEVSLTKNEIHLYPEHRMEKLPQDHRKNCYINEVKIEPHIVEEILDMFKKYTVESKNVKGKPVFVDQLIRTMRGRLHYLTILIMTTEGITDDKRILDIIERRKTSQTMNSIQ